MRNILFILFIIAGLNAAAQKKINIHDFKPLAGKWTGTLTYLDYTSGKPYSMSCKITVGIDKFNNGHFVLDIEYPDEPKANGKDTVFISADGMLVGDEQVISDERVNGVTTIVTEKNGADGNDQRKAVLRYTYEFSDSSFIKRKEVKFDGEEKWILRNEYKMSR